MRFNLAFGNMLEPGKYLTTDFFYHLSKFGDQARFLQRALEELGHEVTVNDTFVDKDAINLFWERFYYNKPRDFPTFFKENGYRYGLICTEPLTTEGLYNPFEFPENVARAAYNGFAHDASHAEFVWYLCEEAAAICRKINPNSHFLPFGHVSGYAELDDPTKRRYTRDFIQTGLPLQRRQDVLEELAKRGWSIRHPGLVPDYIRVSMMGASRIVLSIQKTASHSVFSIARVYHAIMNRVPIIVEYDGPPQYLAPYCICAPSSSLVEICCEQARRSDLPQYAQDTFDRFARELPMRSLMEQLLRDTFGRADPG
jgi:hypothetical protein